nr:MAG TPA: hypothetical protein [Caudoviricetes sp.]
MHLSNGVNYVILLGFTFAGVPQRWVCEHLGIRTQNLLATYTRCSTNRYLMLWFTVPDLRVAKAFAPYEVSRFIQLSLCCLVLLYV